jgi:iron complex outermembrane receptor protein
LSGLVAAWILTAPAGAQGFIAGVVTDSATGAPLGDAKVEARTADGRVVKAVRGNSRGRFQLGPIRAGTWVVQAALLGYSPVRLDGVTVRDGQTVQVQIALGPHSPLLDTIRVVSRGDEDALTSAASTTVINAEQIAERIAPTTFDLLVGQPGMDCASKGVMQRTCAARGSRSASSGALLTLIDGRYAALPAIGFNIPYLMPSSLDDVERIEIVRGPAGALYGPNTERGVVQIITRSAFDAPGTTVDITGGERDLVQGSLRHAGFTGPLGYKLSADYLDGRDWAHTDPNDVRSRDDRVQRVAAAGEIEWWTDQKTVIKTGAGFAQAGSAVDLEPTIGAVQLKDWSFANAFAQFERGTLLGRLFLNWNDSGESFSLWTGMPLEDHSNALAGQLQHAVAVGGGSTLQYGADFRRTDPRTNGTIHGRNENHDVVSEMGAYVLGNIPLGPRFGLSAALRGDYHDRIDGVGLSPRLGLVFQPSETQALRVTYGRGFATPDANDLFADLFVPDATLNPLGYDVRVSGMPREGYRFSRECGGLCMRSPLTSNPEALRPSDATGLWPVAVEFLQSQGGPDLSGIPAPGATDVGSYLAGADGVVDPAEVVDYDPESRSTTDAFEVGYKALLGERLRIGADFAVSHVRNFFGPGVVGTPLAFLEAESLETYLAQFMSPGEAAALAAEISSIPLGVVNPVNAPDPNDLLYLRHQGGEFTRIGVDIDLEYSLSNRLTVGGTYSWVNRDSIGSAGGSDEAVLSAPRNKGALRINYRDYAAGWSVWGQAVAVESYPVQSGQFSGRIPSYAVLDLGGEVRLTRRPVVGLALTVTNALDNRHQEYIGAPEIGRLLVVRLRTQF